MPDHFADRSTPRMALFRRVASICFSLALLGAVLWERVPAPPARADTPAYLVGWYSSVATSTIEQLAAHAASGDNIVLPYSDGIPTDLDIFLNRAARFRLQAMIQPNPRWIVSHNWKALTEFVRRYQNAAALYGWYLFDEPDLQKVPASSIVAAYRVIADADHALNGGHHPIAVAFTTSGCRFGPSGIDPGYLSGLDMLMFDDYQIAQGTQEFASVRPIADEVQRCADVSQRYHKLGTLIILQAFGTSPLNGKPQWSMRDPTYREERYLFWSSVITPTSGVLFWSDYHADRAVRQRVSTVVREFSALRLAPGPDDAATAPIVSGDSRVRVRVIASTGALYLVAVSDSRRRLGARFAFPAELQVAAALSEFDRLRAKSGTYRDRLLTAHPLRLRAFGAHGLPVNYSVLEDTFRPYEVHIYQLQLSGKLTSVSPPNPFYS